MIYLRKTSNAKAKKQARGSWSQRKHNKTFIHDNVVRKYTSKSIVVLLFAISSSRFHNIKQCSVGVLACYDMSFCCLCIISVATKSAGSMISQPRGWGTLIPDSQIETLFFKVFARNCMKMKLDGGARP